MAEKISRLHGMLETIGSFEIMQQWSNNEWTIGTDIQVKRQTRQKFARLRAHCRDEMRHA